MRPMGSGAPERPAGRSARANRKGRSRRLGGLDGRRGSAVGFADLETGEAADGNILAELGDGLIDELLDGDALVLDEMLLVQAVFFVELFHLAGDDLFDHGFGLAGLSGLLAIDFALPVENFLRHFLAA